MTFEKRQHAAQADRLFRSGSGTSATAAASMSTERSLFFAAAASALALGLLVFSSPNYGQTRTEASTPVDTAIAQSSVVNVENEPAPSLTVQPPLPGPLAQGVVFIPYRLENLRIVPVGGAAARDISPRVGHLHITLDDLPWQWADYGGSNTVILVGLPRGEHKVRIEAVDPEGRPFTARTVTFTVPGPASSSR